MRLNPLEDLVTVMKVKESGHIFELSDSKKIRVNELNEFIRQLYRHLLSAANAHSLSNHAIWNILEKNITDPKFLAKRKDRIFPIVIEILGDTVHWQNSRKRKRSLKRKTFNNNMALIRADYKI